MEEPTAGLGDDAMTDAQQDLVVQLLEVFPSHTMTWAQRRLEQHNWNVQVTAAALLGEADPAREGQRAGPSVGGAAADDDDWFKPRPPSAAQLAREAAERKANRWWDTAMCLHALHATRQGAQGPSSGNEVVARSVSLLLEMLEEGQPVDAIGGPRASTALHDACFWVKPQVRACVRVCVCACVRLRAP